MEFKEILCNNSIQERRMAMIKIEQLRHEYIEMGMMQEDAVSLNQIKN
jgi:hypothetical protein